METQDITNMANEIEQEWQRLAQELNLRNPQMAARISAHALYYWCTEHALRKIVLIAAKELFGEGDEQEKRDRFMNHLAALKAEVATKLALVSAEKKSRQMSRKKKK